MAHWSEFAAAAPGLARRVQELFESQKHMTLATLRRDGSPRISGTEARIDDGDLLIGMMSRSVKALDLLRDPRMALHGPAIDPPAGDPSAWGGDAKVAGRAVLIAGDDADDSHQFWIDIGEAVVTAVGSPADHLVIDSWTPVRGVESRRRQ